MRSPCRVLIKDSCLSISLDTIMRASLSVAVCIDHSARLLQGPRPNRNESSFDHLKTIFQSSQLIMAYCEERHVIAGFIGVMWTDEKFRTSSDRNNLIFFFFFTLQTSSCFLLFFFYFGDILYSLWAYFSLQHKVLHNQHCHG